MSVQALGIYLRTLRTGQRMTQTLVADQAGMNVSTLHRIEKGEVEPEGKNVLNLVAVVRGSYEDARRLWSDKDAGAKEGEAAARRRLDRGELEQLEQLRALFGDDEIAEAVARIANDRELLKAILRLGDVVGPQQSHG